MKVNLTINGKPIVANEGDTILKAAKDNEIYIPSLCYLEGVHQFGGCRMCMVEVEGAKTLIASCMMQVREGMVVNTNTARARHARRLNLELLLSNHPQDCLNCARSGSCELQELTQTLGINTARFRYEMGPDVVDISPSLTRDMAKCILCRRCVSVCNKVQEVGVLNAQNRGFKTLIGPAAGIPIAEGDCTNCGQCVVACPVGALKETDAIQAVWAALNNPEKTVVVQVAPAIRVAIGEEFGMPIGTPATGKLAAALKELQFDVVFDTDFAADLTIMEEGSEFLERAKAALTGGKAVLPMITSCSPGWVKYLENFFPEMTGNLSTCKSPHTMLGALVKSYYAQKENLDPKNIFMVSVMPCTAKKYEILRPEMQNDGMKNVDAVLTTRELAKMIKEAGIDFANLKDARFDDPMGISTGAADIFGVTGGVMEAALRTVYELVTGRELPSKNLHVEALGTEDQIKTAQITFENVLPAFSFLEGFTAKVAVTSGFAGAGKLMNMIKKGEIELHFIEVMGCPGGCITGGGQPRSTVRSKWADRKSAIYKVDEDKPFRKSHESPAIKRIYEDFLEKPLGHKSHEYLHTTYTKRGRYNELVGAEKKEQ